MTWFYACPSFAAPCTWWTGGYAQRCGDGAARKRRQQHQLLVGRFHLIRIAHGLSSSISASCQPPLRHKHTRNSTGGDGYATRSAVALLRAAPVASVGQWRASRALVSTSSCALRANLHSLKFLSTEPKVQMSIAMKPHSVTRCRPRLCLELSRASHSIRKTLIRRKTLSNLTSCHTHTS